MALINCSECGKQVSDRAAACPHCGAPVAGKAVDTAKGADDEKQSIGKTKIGCLPLFLVVIAVFVVWGALDNDSRRTTASNRSASQSASVGVGQDGRVVVDSGSVVVCVSPQAYERFVKMAVANDTLGMSNLTAQGGAFLVPSGTRVRVIDRRLERREVRILEGPFAGRSGWVTSSSVVK